MAAHTIHELDGLGAITHPVRLEILRSLREPDSASGVGRRLGLGRQRVNYHLKELERVGLVRLVGERTKRNMIERLYQAVATSFVVSPRAMWDPARARAVRDQAALDQLVAHAERVQADAGALLDRTVLDGAVVPSATVTAEVRFADDGARAAFLSEYLDQLGRLIDRYASADGEAFRVGATVYPEPEPEEARA